MSDLDVGLLHAHAAFEGTSASATIFCGDHPFAVGVRQAVNWDDTNAGLIVAAVAGPVAYSPPGLEREVISSNSLVCLAVT